MYSLDGGFKILIKSYTRTPGTKLFLLLLILMMLMAKKIPTQYVCGATRKYRGQRRLSRTYPAAGLWPKFKRVH